MTTVIVLYIGFLVLCVVACAIECEEESRREQSKTDRCLRDVQSILQEGRGFK